MSARPHWAEAVGGTEAKFVKMMNQRAAKLGMKSAKFYNPHGLPNYDASAITAKRQNSMTASPICSRWYLTC